MAVDNKIVFGGVDSSTYNIYISGEGVFNAPKRDVEMITIPGRNGAFALDNGRFENITVTYPAFTYETSMATFKQNLANFRNALASKKGYQRLTDTFHTDEYRMAAFIDGIEIKPIKYNTASEFTITFDCKPQRFLTSGETAVSVDSGDTLTNPTLFEASPLLEVEGYGTIDVNGTEIEIADELVGDVIVEGTTFYSNTAEVSFANVFIVNGDTIDIASSSTIIENGQSIYKNLHDIASATITGYGGDSSITPTISLDGNVFTITVYLDSASFAYGTPTNKSSYCTVKEVYDNSVEYINTFYFKVSYDGNKTITCQISGGKNIRNIAMTIGDITIHSTATTFGHPTYIDCDLGEAYAIDNDGISSLNSYIALGSKLPTLSVGSSEITFDNTITDLKVVPRWWKI